jgi:hypothetical protein
MASILLSFKDLEQNLITSSEAPRVKLTPRYAPLRFSGSVIAKDSIERELDSNSSATFSNIVPNVYSVELWTHRKETAYEIIVPNNATGSLTGSNYIVSDFTGSGDRPFKLAGIPATTASVGNASEVAFGLNFIYVCLSSGSVFSRVSTGL